MRFIRVLLLSLLLMLSGCASMGAYLDKKADLYAEQDKAQITDSTLTVYRLGEDPYEYETHIFLPDGQFVKVIGYSKSRGVLILHIGVPKHSRVLEVERKKSAFYRLSRSQIVGLWWTEVEGEVCLGVSVYTTNEE